MTPPLDPKLLALGQPDLIDDHDGDPVQGLALAVAIGLLFWGALGMRIWAWWVL